MTSPVGDASESSQPAGRRAEVHFTDQRQPWPEQVSDIVFDMKVSTRSLVREFPKIKSAARKGQKVEIYDGRTGEVFFLTAKPKKTFGELAEMAKGVYSGPRNLSSREGFDAWAYCRYRPTGRLDQPARSMASLERLGNASARTAVDHLWIGHRGSGLASSEIEGSGRSALRFGRSRGAPNRAATSRSYCAPPGAFRKISANGFLRCRCGSALGDATPRGGADDGYRALQRLPTFPEQIDSAAFYACTFPKMKWRREVGRIASSRANGAAGVRAT